jgi:hypothetical protein
VSQQVLHLDFIALKPETTHDQRRHLIDVAASLIGLEHVLTIGLLEAKPGADFDMVFFFLLPDFEALEPFGTDPRYSRFLQGSVAPVLRAFAGADVLLESDFDMRDGLATCIALSGPDETYDWEVREALEAWAGDRAEAAATVVGVAVGERQRFRGASLRFGEGEDAESDSSASSLAAISIQGTATRLAKR